jgi:hypothetical protein
MAGLVPAIHDCERGMAEIRGCPALRPGMTIQGKTETR